MGGPDALRPAFPPDRPLTMADALSDTLAHSLVGGDATMEALVREELIKGQYAEQALAEAEQLRIAEANHRIERAFADGLGQCTMAVDLGVYTYWQNREPGCWADKDFRKRMLRDNPQMRVKSRSKKMQISFARPSVPKPETRNQKPEGILCAP